jgi:hypothetical protein
MPLGRPLLEILVLAVPPDVDGGDLKLVIATEESEVSVGAVRVEDPSRIYDVPPHLTPVEGVAEGIAAVEGFDVRPEGALVVGEPITVTLAFRAGTNADSADLKVFVHLVTSGEVVAQDDAQPANWLRPTSGWVSGEVVVDTHVLKWHRVDLFGDAEIRIGFYDPVTGTRVRWSNGADVFLLPRDVHLLPTE